MSAKEVLHQLAIAERDSEIAARKYEIGCLDAKVERLEAEGAILREALARCVKLFDKALPKFNWGASCLDAEAIRLLNEVPPAARSALEKTKP